MAGVFTAELSGKGLAAIARPLTVLAYALPLAFASTVLPFIALWFESLTGYQIDPRAWDMQELLIKAYFGYRTGEKGLEVLAGWAGAAPSTLRSARRLARDQFSHERALAKAERKAEKARAKIARKAGG